MDAGNTVAGPVFNAVTLEAARYLNIPADYVFNPNDKNQKIKSVVPPSVKYAAELAGKTDSVHAPSH